MELGGQEQEKEMPSSLGYNHLLPNKFDPSSKFSSPPPTACAPRERSDQTLDRSHLYPQNHHIPNPDQHTNIPGRDYPEAKLDPAPIAAAAGAAQITVTTRSHGEPPPPVPARRAQSPPSQTPAATSSTTVAPFQYRECLKNHAASMGSHVVDGCGEFMPGGEEGTLEFFRCAACECHRNFHRKEIVGERRYSLNSHYYNSISKNNDQGAALPPLKPHYAIPQPIPINLQHRFSYGSPSATAATPAQPVMVAFGCNMPEESSSEDLTMIQPSDIMQPLAQVKPSKKRFRTKFTQQQRDKMMEFAEKLGWRIQKQDEREVQQFCAEVGVKRQVFKVWMHNNKQTTKKQQL